MTERRTPPYTELAAHRRLTALPESLKAGTLTLVRAADA